VGGNIEHQYKAKHGECEIAERHVLDRQRQASGRPARSVHPCERGIAPDRDVIEGVRAAAA
jgi:hypothetical protein